MKVKVSKVFADFITKTVKGAEAQVAYLTPGQYAMSCGNLVDAISYGDFDQGSGLYKAIRVSYPPEWYACSRYVSTKELTKEFRRRGVKDAEGLKEMLRYMLTI